MGNSTVVSPGFDVSMALQIATFLVAAIGPLLAYVFARKLAVSANRQAWLDALRQDLASLIALADSVAAITVQAGSATDEKFKSDCVHLLRDKATELQVVRYRIRLRLRSGNLEHLQLLEAINALCEARKDSASNRQPLREAVVTLAETVIMKVWRRIERGG